MTSSTVIIILLILILVIIFFILVITCLIIWHFINLPKILQHLVEIKNLFEAKDCCEEAKSDTGLFQEILVKFDTEKEDEEKYVKDDFIKKARNLYPGLQEIDESEFDARICKCNNQVAVVFLKNGLILGEIQNSPLTGDGVDQGDVNYYSDITFESLVISEKLISKNVVEYKPNQNNDQSELYLGNATEVEKWIDVIFLDTAIDRTLLRHFINTRPNSIDINLIKISEASCIGDEPKSMTHGTAVVFCFLERYFETTRSNKVGINIIVYDVSRFIPELQRVVIPQFRVVCALLKIAKEYPDCKYMNMSFGFDIPIPQVKELITGILINNCILTCSAGNKGWNITNPNGLFNYPSGYSRINGVTGKLYEVFGNMGYGTTVVQEWDDGEDNKTNFTIPSIHSKSRHDNAVWNETNNSGGTSFAAPRALASLIP